MRREGPFTNTWSKTEKRLLDLFPLALELGGTASDRIHEVTAVVHNLVTVSVVDDLAVRTPLVTEDHSAKGNVVFDQGDQSGGGSVFDPEGADFSGTSANHPEQPWT